jgi:two-component system cell cycle sensor histidine kinase PleC
VPGVSMSRRHQHRSLLNEYCDQLALLIERGRTERALIIAKHQAENAATRAKDAMRKAQATDRAKTLFLGAITQELRTPLNAILGFSELLQSPPRLSEVPGYAAHIQEAGMIVLGMLNGAIELVRMETGNLELDDQEVALEEILDSAIRPLRKSAADKSITVIRRTKADCRLWIDPEKIAQAFTNILSNAIKFTPEDGRIEIDAEFTGTGGLLVMVRDNGSGIPADKVDRVLQPFGQAEKQLMRHGALGLGLPIARALISMHGGELTLASQVDKGTTAGVALPPERVLQPSARER